MSGREDLAKLSRLGTLILDHRLAALRKAAAEKAHSQAQLAGLAAAPAEGLGLVADAQANLRYNRWADARRAEINLRLAAQTAIWMEAQVRARQALGRAEVLETLSKMPKSIIRRD